MPGSAGESKRSLAPRIETTRLTGPVNYQTLTMPAPIVWGDSDTVIPLKEGQYLQNLMPNAELVVMKGVNHIPHIEDLDAPMEIVLGSLQSPR
jgi:pimeloyl-ACP methyl ester carboxylesterase